MVNRILVPLDGSKRAEDILQHVMPLAECFGAKLILLQVVVPVYYAIDPQLSHVDIDMEATQRQQTEASAYLESKLKKLQGNGMEVETVVAQGSIVETIIDVAQMLDADLIAMASHGRSGLARVFYGSVAAGVLQKVDRPLLLIRSRDED
jgi:nucleotide-binding universal stress UspA family protein